MLLEPFEFFQSKRFEFLVHRNVVRKLGLEPVPSRVRIGADKEKGRLEPLDRTGDIRHRSEDDFGVDVLDETLVQAGPVPIRRKALEESRCRSLPALNSLCATDKCFVFGFARFVGHDD
jgi:hypothetical protein